MIRKVAKTRRNRVRRVMKWVGLAGCVLLFVACVGSVFVRARFPIDRYSFVMIHGLMVLMKFPLDHVARPWGISVLSTPRMQMLPKYVYYPNQPGFWSGLYIPLWIPLVLLAIPTIILWLRDQRKPEGCCQQCGYNLTGLPEPRCPECGTEFDPSTLPHELGTDAEDG